MSKLIGNFGTILAFVLHCTEAAANRMLLLDLALKKKIHDINISSGKKLCGASNSYSSTIVLTLLTLNQLTDGRRMREMMN